MRRVATALAVMLVAGACSQEAEGGTTTTTAATTTTTTALTTTSATTTTTAPPFTGLLLMVPDDCDGCGDLADTLTDLARGEVPIQVLAAPEGDQRPAVQVVALDGTVVAEWKGAEATVLPRERASVENAGAMILAACEMLGGCSPDTTSTTTTTLVSELQPNDVVCGMDVERRYNFDGVRPAPLGVIWSGTVWEPAGPSRVLSGILVGYAPHPTIGNSYYADFLFPVGDECVVFRFRLGSPDGDHYLLTNGGSSGIPDLLPFGYSQEAKSVALDSWVTSRASVVRRLVIGRQYVFAVLDQWNERDCPATAFGCVSISATKIIAYLEGRTEVVPEVEAYVYVWFAPTGSI